MGTVYNKTIASGFEKSVVLAPQDYYEATFSVGGSWTSLYVAFALSMVSLTDDNAAGVDEVGGNLATPKNNFWVGLKTPNDLIPRGDPNTVFAGLAVGAAPDYLDTNVAFGVASGNIGTSNVGCCGLSVTSGTSILASYQDYTNTGFRFHMPSDPSATTNFCTPLALQFDVINSTTVAVSVKTGFMTLSNFDPSNPTMTALRSYAKAGDGWLVRNLTVGGGFSFPNGIFLYNPFLQNRIRLHCMEFEKLA